MASSIFLPIIATIIGMILIPVVFFVAVLINRGTKNIEIEPNSPIIRCDTRKEFTDGYVEGQIIKDLPRKNKTRYIKFQPLDSTQGWNKERPEPQTLIIAEEFLDRGSKGETSSRREIITVLPRSKIDLAKGLRNTDIGEMMSAKGQLAHLERQIAPYFIKGGDQAIKSLLSEYGNRGEMSSDAISHMKQTNKKIMEMLMLKNEEKKK